MFQQIIKQEMTDFLASDRSERQATGNSHRNNDKLGRIRSVEGSFR